MQNVMKSRGAAIAVLAAMMLGTISISGGPVATERKLLLTPRGENRRVAPADLAEPHARVVAEYEAMHVVAVPEVAVDHVSARLHKLGFDVTELDDVIETPRRKIKPGVDHPPPAPFTAGLFIVQYTAPATAAWQAALRGSGVVVVQSLPGRAVLVAASVEQVARLSKLPWVQYTGPYVAEYKYAPLAPPGHTEFTIQIANTVGSAPAINAIRERVGGFLSESRYESELTARIRTDDLASAQALLNEPFVIAVEAYVPAELSDERQALSLTGAAVPTGGNYLTWLANRGITPTALTNSGIVVDVADTGVDMGCSTSTTLKHKDLLGRIVYYTSALGSSATDRSDTVGHGTVVAGIVGGNPSAGVNSVGAPTTGFAQKDGDSYGQFYYGMGIAPGIRIGSTKIKNNVSVLGTVHQWTTLAVSQDCNTPTNLCPQVPTWIDPTPNCVATVQTHSTNIYDPAVAGAYTIESRDVDISVRNASRTTPPAAMVPLAITISAGNYTQNPADVTRTVLPWATAKNAITMGAAESARLTPTACMTDLTGGPDPAERYRAEGYNVVAYCSRRGTNDGRLKPDLMAPATLALGPKTRANSNSWCAVGGDFTGTGSLYAYHGSSGTSFAAPVAAGSIALLRYYFDLNYGVTPSPAMYKAMLVGGAKSMTGGVDRQESFIAGAPRTVTAWPNTQQGFGLLNLSDLLTLNVTKSTHDQQTVLMMGQAFNRSVTVADPSKPLRIVLVWTDAPAVGGATTAAVNNLNLRVDSYYGNYIGTDGFSRIPPGCGRPSCPPPSDSKNNVEAVNVNPIVFVDPAKRTLGLQVFASNLNGVGVPGQSGGANNQDFALFVLNGTLQ